MVQLWFNRCIQARQRQREKQQVLVDADEAKVKKVPAYLGVQNWPLTDEFPPVVLLPPPWGPSVSPSPPEVVGQPAPPAGGKEEEEEGARGGGGEVDEEGVEGRRQAPHLVHLAHIASEQTKCKGGKGEDGAGS